VVTFFVFCVADKKEKQRNKMASELQKERNKINNLINSTTQLT
jgi:plasmid maintenance system antidote protein VapI